MPPAEPFWAFRPARIADQAAEALRERIESGAWSDFLPGEFELARRLGVGRSSIHAALAQLAKDGLVEIRQGRRCRIRSEKGGRPIPGPATVCLVTAIPRDKLSHVQHPLISSLHAQFSDAGVAWEQVFDFSLGGSSARRLRGMMAGRRRICWLLFQVSARIQRWFEGSGAPTLVVGHRYQGMTLPSVDTNYHAAGWHAAGRLAHEGHRRIAVVLPAPVTAGDLAWRDGVADYSAKSGKSLSIVEVTGGDSRSVLLFRVDRLLRQSPRPTAILSVLPENTLAIYVHLLESGLRLPRDISLIGGDSDALLDRAVPGLTRYSVDSAKQVRRTVRIAHSLMAGNRLPQRPSLIVPRFMPGATLGPPPG